MITNNIHIKLLGTIALSVGLVVILFLSSERQVHRNNAFTRRYPPHPVKKHYELDLGVNSYYIAGFDRDLLYLGNRTAPWHMLGVHLKTRDTTVIRLVPEDRSLAYRSLKVHILPPYFFVMDGSMPFVLRGLLGEWTAKPWLRAPAYFSKGIPVDSHRIFIRTMNASTQRYALGIIEKTDSFQIHLDTTVLQAQVDGVFDVDGMLAKNNDSPQLGYFYFYRNQFMVMDSQLNTIQRQRTIDTVQTAQITTTEQKGMHQMKSPPWVSNRSGNLHGSLFLLQSDRLGRNEPKDILDKASIIDVYDHQGGTYEFSFYIDDIDKAKLREFALENGILVALIGNRLAVFRTVEDYFDPK